MARSVKGLAQPAVPSEHSGYVTVNGEEILVAAFLTQQRSTGPEQLASCEVLMVGQRGKRNWVLLHDNTNPRDLALLNCSGGRARQGWAGQGAPVALACARPAPPARCLLMLHAATMPARSRDHQQWHSVRAAQRGAVLEPRWR